jgi:hypothetical protein
MIESVNRVTCDGCGKSVERGTSFAADELPEGWVTLEVGWNEPDAGGNARRRSRSGEFHSKPCAARWLVKRERTPIQKPGDAA